MELLAPAGGIGTALAAFEAGADAVYVGLNKFNARERTENFSFEQLSKLLSYAHARGRRVHVAVNTLVKESELGEVAEYLAKLADLAPDAVIVQDFGVLLMIKRYFPTLTVHASTQMGVHNSAGAEFAAENGAKRVILERQTTLEELAAIRAKCPELELEVFAHGALCCALSGGCLMSSYLGGASGNRGKCKQPCRRFYTSEDRGAGGYFLSPSDLETLPLLSEFRRIGVDSLKLEGRMKKADYVRNVVAAYRAALDDPDSAQTAAASAIRLTRTAGRESSTGFFDAGNFGRLIRSDRPGVWGFRVGVVTGGSATGLTVRLEKRLHRGDRVRLLTVCEEDGPALTCASLSVAGRPVNVANPREVCFIACRDCGRIPKGAAVFKIGECVKDLSAAAEALPERKIPLELTVRLSRGELTVRVDNFKIPVWRELVELRPAEKRKVSAADLEKLFAETASPRFKLARAKVEICGELFLPASLGKELRRKFYAFLERNAPLFSRSAEGLARFFADYRAMSHAPSCRRRTVLGSRAGGEVNAMPLALWKGEAGVDELALPQFCPEGELSSVRRRVERAVKEGVRRFRAANAWALQMLKEFDGAEVTVAPPLPAANSLAAALFAENGATACEIWTELERGEAEKMLAKSPLPLQQHTIGAVELMQSRARFPVTGEIIDRRGNRFRLIKDPADRLCKVLTDGSVDLELLPGAGEVEDLRHPSDGETSDFNWRGAWL